MALLTSLIGAGGGGGGSSTLSGLTDTNISSPLDTETLTYDTPSGKWVNATASASVATLNAVGNVTITSNSSGELIKWNGSAWINNTLAEAGISATGHTHATTDITSGTFADARIAESNVTQHEAAIDHDALTNFVANEHIDWTGASSNFSTTGTGAFGGDITDYEATNDGNPEIRLGAADAEELHIQTVYASGTQVLDYVLFQTDVASAVADRGLYRFNVDGTNILDIDDGGLELTGSITVSGTVDGRDIATDGTKLDGIEALADVTDYANVDAALSGGTVGVATVATGDKVLIQDVDDSDNLKYVTAQSIADLGASGTLSNVVEDTTPQLGGALDVNGNQITSVSAGDIELHSDNDVNIILGDALGVDDFNIKDSADAIVFGVNSDGAVTATGDIDISGQSLISTTAADIGIHSDNDVNITLGDSGGLDDLNVKNSGNTLVWSVDSNGQQTMTSNIVMADNSVTGVDTITFTDTAGTIAGIENQNLVDKTAGETITGAWNFGGATTLEIPNSATPSVTVDGQVAIDTTVTDFSTGIMKYYGGEEMGVVSMPIAEFTSPTDTHVVAYNATNDEFELVAPDAGGLSASANEVITGDWDFGGAGSLEIPNSATPTVNANGEIAIDTTVTDFSAGVLKYYSTEEMAVVAMPIAELTTPTDGHVVSYNATNDEFELAAGGGGSAEHPHVGPFSQSGGTVSDIGTPLAPMYSCIGTTEILSSMCTVGDIAFWPGYIPKTQTYNDISIFVSTAQASHVVELIIYSVGSDGLPDTKIWESGSIDCATTGTKAVAIDAELTEGLIWIAILHDNGNTAHPSFWASSDVQTEACLGVVASTFTGNITHLKTSSQTYTVGNAPTAPTSLTKALYGDQIMVLLEVD